MSLKVEGGDFDCFSSGMSSAGAVGYFAELLPKLWILHRRKIFSRILERNFQFYCAKSIIQVCVRYVVTKLSVQRI